MFPVLVRVMETFLVLPTPTLNTPAGPDIPRTIPQSLCH